MVRVSSVVVAALLFHAATIRWVVLALNVALPGCRSSCGDIAIPYPFGIGPGCFLDGFNLTCHDRSYRPPRLFLGDGTTVEVLEISLENATVRVRNAMVVDSPEPETYLYTRRDQGNNAWDWNAASSKQWNATWGRALGDGPYHLAERRNRLVVIGCNVQAVVLHEPRDDTIAACISICTGRTGEGQSQTSLHEQGMAYASRYGCSGVGCCQTTISLGFASYKILLYKLRDGEFSSPITPYIADEHWFNETNVSMLVNTHSGGSVRPVVPAVLGWAIGASAGCPIDGGPSTACRSRNSSCRKSTTSSHSGYTCHCSGGYQGNPYNENGCQDIDECADGDSYPCYGMCINVPGSFHCICPEGTQSDDPTKRECVPTSTRKISAGLLVGLGVGGGMGLLSLVFGVILVMQKVKARRAKKLRARFFKQNRGLLLQKLVDKDIAERMIFSLDELEMATSKFDEVRKLGGGGHGTVYKGILSNQHVVAIKKSKITIQRESDNFINEVAILSQINHRNVVRLFGCCLETQVPLLVYEFVSNGTLSDHLHVEHSQSLSWDDRLRIALETASALAYLHSSASMSIIHRDIKSTNILLDDRMTAKVSDFGASRGIPIDQAGVTTAIQGTFGYLDPEYYQTSRLTDKSDVYSFGVVLVELLTRKKPYASMPSAGASLVGQFNLVMSQDKICEILDPQVILEGMEDAKEVAALASTCLSLSGEERPTMKQVEMRLERLLGSNKNTEQGRSAELNCTPTQISNNSDNTSRRYSMEQEFLLSASFSR